MLNGSFEIPVGYGDINIYNAQFSPSTVHVKNTALQRYFRKYLLQKAISVFKWTLPEEWDADYFRYVLYGIGYIAVLETRTFGVICQGGALGGYNLYYRPSYIIVTNPHLKETITANIGTDCAIIKLQPDYSSIMDIVGFYADQMALCAEALGMNLVNVKTGVVFGAENKTQAESYRRCMTSWVTVTLQCSSERTCWMTRENLLGIRLFRICMSNILLLISFQTCGR